MKAIPVNGLLSLVAALLVVLVGGGEGDCNQGPQLLKIDKLFQSHSSSKVHPESAPTRVGLDNCIHQG